MPRPFLTDCEHCGTRVDANEPYSQIARVKYRMILCSSCYHQHRWNTLPAHGSAVVPETIFECPGCEAKVAYATMEEVSGPALKRLIEATGRGHTNPTYVCADCYELTL